MPFINKPKRQRNWIPKHDKNKDIAIIYNSSKWVKLRNAYLMQHPLCEQCLENGKTTPTEEIHHIRPISTGKDKLEMEQLAYDGNNLMALCKECHHQIHNNMRKNNNRK